MDKWNEPVLNKHFQRLLDDKRFRDAVEGPYSQMRKKALEGQFSYLANSSRTELERMLEAVTSSLASFAQISRIDTPFHQLEKLAVGIKRDDQARFIGFVGSQNLILTIQSQASWMAGVSAAAEALYRRTDWEKLNASISSIAALAVRLEPASLQLASDYKTLMDSFTEGQIYTISPNVTALPSVEMFLAGDLAYSLSPSDSEESEIVVVQEVRANVIAELPELSVLLHQIDSGLSVMLDGARRSLIGDNPDRVRHVTTTLREIFTKVLHYLSPDSDLVAWSKESSHFDEKGRPTRRARLLFIVRTIGSRQLEKFLESDIEATLKFLEAFQGGTHGAPGKFTDDQLRAMLVRMEGLLRFLLEIKRG